MIRLIRDAAAQLGTHKTTFEGNSRLGTGIVVLIATGLVAAMFFIFTYLGYVEDPDQIEGLVLVGGLGVIALLIGFIAFHYIVLRFRGLSVKIYTDGFVRNHGNKVQAVRWDDIVRVWQSITHVQRYGQTISTNYLYTLELNDRRKLKFGNEIKDIAGLGQTIQQEVTNRLIPKVMQSFNSGETIDFGEFRVNKTGVMQGRKSLEWVEVEGAQINNGFVTFKKQGKWLNWANVRAAKIPNLPAFLMLIDHTVGVKPGS